MSQTLIVRYSQIGDVIIAIPVIYSLAKQYPEEHFTVLTNSKFEGIFQQMPSNVTLLPMIYRKKKGAFRGINYLFDRYFLLLKIFFSKKYDKVALLQNGTFEDQLKKLLALKGSQIASIDLKNFLSKEKLTSNGKSESINQLYIKTLSEIGYKGIQANFDISFYKNKEKQIALLQKNQLGIKKQLIGIAPFSRLKAKVYPLERMESVIAYFKDKSDIQLVIFGGGNDEKMVAEKWQNKYSNVTSLIGKLSFDDELLMIASLNVMLTMDSANLHLASLVETPAISIWGPSHPKLGYYPCNQPISNTIWKGLACSPCSFWGENPCLQKRQYACMDIDPQIIITRIENILT